MDDLDYIIWKYLKMRILIIILLVVLANFTIDGANNLSMSKSWSKKEPQNYYDFTTPSRKNSTYKNIKSPYDLVANAVLNLGINIFQQTARKSNVKMQVISPLSIAGATALIELGANGKTLKELMEIHGQTES